MIIDTPGMREIQLSGHQDGVAEKPSQILIRYPKSANLAIANMKMSPAAK